MGPIKEWKCKEHGVFDASHPICPEMGCTSASVERIFLTPPGIKSEFVKRHEQGVKQLAANYGQSDFKTAQAGEIAKAHSRAPELLWGDAGARAMGMQSFGDLTARTSQPFTVQRDGRQVTVPHGMQQAAREIGITQKVVPDAAGGVTVHRTEPQMKSKVA